MDEPRNAPERRLNKSSNRNTRPHRKNELKRERRPRARLYGVVALGGTFDVFHKGHEQLLSAAFKLSRRVIVGITSDHLVKSLGKTHPVEPYRFRTRQVRRFLSKNGWSGRAQIFSLDDPYGPAARRKNLEAIVLTSNTLTNGRKLNRLRGSRGLSRLRIETVPIAIARDGKTISSTRIRNGEIDRHGHVLTRHRLV